MQSQFDKKEKKKKERRRKKITSTIWIKTYFRVGDYLQMLKIIFLMLFFKPRMKGRKLFIEKKTEKKRRRRKKTLYKVQTNPIPKK